MNWGKITAISVAGGKGGIGKSSFTASLGYTIAASGKRVVIVDADIGAANLHTMVGITYPRRTLADYFKDPNLQLEDIVLDTPYPNLRLISSACDVLAIVAPNYDMNQRFFRNILSLDTDVVIFDIAAGTNNRAIDFFALAPIGVIIVEPLPTAMENAFLFIKNLLFRFLLRMFYQDAEMKTFIQDILSPENEYKNLQFDLFLQQIEERAPEKTKLFREIFSREKYKICLVANSVHHSSQVEAIDRFARIVKRYLGLAPQTAGILPFEPAMDVAISKRMPFVAKYPQSGYAKSVTRIAASLVK